MTHQNVHQPRSQGLSSLPPLVVGRKTLVAAGHVTTQKNVRAYYSLVGTLNRLPVHPLKGVMGKKRGEREGDLINNASSKQKQTIYVSYHELYPEFPIQMLWRI